MKVKKKAEFPDAFVLSAIENWCEMNNENIYLLSKDSDWENYAKSSKRMFVISSIEELFEIITFNYEKLSKSAIEKFNQNVEEIRKIIENEFLKLDFFVEDVDGIIENIDVTEIEVVEKYLISLETDSSLVNFVAQFDLIASVSFFANVHYADEETAIYDSEEKQMYIWNYIDEKIKRSSELKVDIKLSYDKNHDIAEISFIRISNPKNIWIQVKNDQSLYY